MQEHDVNVSISDKDAETLKENYGIEKDEIIDDVQKVVKEEVTGKKKKTPAKKKKMTLLEKAKAELDSAISTRTGYYTIPSLTFDDLKFVRNAFRNKIGWKGGQEAFLIVTAAFELEQAVTLYDPNKKGPKENNTGEIQLRGGCIESVLFFLNRFEGKGLDSAQRFFKIYFQIQNAAATFPQQDENIKMLKEKVAKLEEKESKKKSIAKEEKSNT